jgi:post-segregation antitoxin (ccd killing protein)
MPMARVNVYLPDELARAARAAGLSISKVTQAALSGSLAHSETER